MSISTNAFSTYHVTFKEVCRVYHQAYCTLAYKSWYVNQGRHSITRGRYPNDIDFQKESAFGRLSLAPGWLTALRYDGCAILGTCKQKQIIRFENYLRNP